VSRGEPDDSSGEDSDNWNFYFTIATETGSGPEFNSFKVHKLLNFVSTSQQWILAVHKVFNSRNHDEGIHNRSQK
jgi:hypothetical protein